MGIRLRVTGIATGILLVLLIQPTAKADSFQVTGSTDLATCAMVSFCSNISYTLNLTTTPPVDDNRPGVIPRTLLYIDSVSGQVNGLSLSCTPPLCADLLASSVYYSGPPIPDDYIGMFGDGSVPISFSLGALSSLTNHIFLLDVGNDTGAYVTWNIVSTPEPSALLFLSIGLLGLMGLTLFKNRLS